MSGHHHPTELDSGTTADSVMSSPLSEHPPNSTHHNATANTTTNNNAQARVRFMCSFGGKILPRPHDNQLRYVGGDTRIVTINRHTSFATLLSKLSKLSGTSDINVKYQLPNEDLDALITVTSDEDVENMMDEYDRLAHNHKTARLRLFLFPVDGLSRASSISSLLNGSTKREHWFLDALNNGSSLERGRSEVSSIVSEVPDYLFGLDSSDDPPKLKSTRANTLVSDNVSMSDPGSPDLPVLPSPFCSTSSTLGPGILPPIPDLRPIKIRPENPPPVVEPKDTLVEPGNPGLRQTDYQGQTVQEMQPTYYIHRTSSPAPTMQEMQPIYYIPGSMQHGTVPIQSIPIRAPFMQHFPPPPGQVPLGIHQPITTMGQAYGGGGRPVLGGDPYEIPVRIGDGSNQPVYYPVRYSGVPGYPGMVVTSMEEMQPAPPGSEGKMGRAPN